MREPVNTCPDCGDFHFYPWQCPFDLHGEDDFFKSDCAVCETNIPSGADRVGDRFGNLYCSLECANSGLNKLLGLLLEQSESYPDPQATADD